MEKQHTVLNIYHCLYNHFGPQEWWPGETSFEIIIGAILTQNTAWTNVEKAIKNLKIRSLLEPKALWKTSEETLAGLIKPAGYYNLKAKRIKSFLDFLFSQYRGSLKKMFEEDILRLRERLLRIKGVGGETADSILLYAGEKPVFVVDAYTKRFLVRHNLVEEKADYKDIQRYFMDNLPLDVRLFNEFHALIVRLGKDICINRKPKCEVCPLQIIG